MYSPKCKAPHDPTVQCIFSLQCPLICCLLSLVLFTCVLGISYVTQFVLSQWDA